jgi:hypothetical protein
MRAAPRYMREKKGCSKISAKKIHTPRVCVCVYTIKETANIRSAPTADHFISCAQPAREILIFPPQPSTHSEDFREQMFINVCATVSSV